MPNITTRPAVGRIKPSNMRIVVVLPEPLGPRNPNTSPRMTSRCKSLTATSFPNALVNRLVLIMQSDWCAGSLFSFNICRLSKMRMSRERQSSHQLLHDLPIKASIQGCLPGQSHLINPIQNELEIGVVPTRFETLAWMP